MAVDPREALNSGAAILSSLLDRHRFVYQFMDEGHGSGGNSASGAFLRTNRKLEIHFRHTLGLISYQLGEHSISHKAYMWSVLGEPNASRYPGFSENPLDGFRDLYADLEEHGADFLSGPDADFLRHVERAAALEKARQRLPG